MLGVGPEDHVQYAIEGSTKLHCFSRIMLDGIMVDAIKAVVHDGVWAPFPLGHNPHG